MQRSLLFKCLLLAGLGLLLLVPLGMIEHTIRERTAFRDEAVRSIAASTAGVQRLVGPVLAIPVVEEYDEELASNQEHTAVRTVRKRRNHVVTLLPKRVRIDGGLTVDQRAYGIHHATVFNLHGVIAGSFDPPAEADLPIPGRNAVLHWGSPRLVLGIDDVRGLI
ncbi:MAG: inner membrane CreD family protein, partial [Rhodocyclales bacterium]|nr:inner membrane CreD family protein [Rhodocyclales bacterium]